MQELRIKQEMDGYNDILRILDENCCTDNLLLQIEDDKSANNIVIDKIDAKQIISFLQNYFNL